MIEIQSICTECRICKNSNLVDVIDLGQQVITSRFPLYGDFSTPSTPIVLSLCTECSLVQLKYSTNASELYEYEYGYRSGINNTMRQHLKSYNDEILSKVVGLTDGDAVVDIGSNDSTMLQNYSSKLKRIGVDPTGKQFSQYYGDVELIPTYFTLSNFRNVYSDIRPKVVSSISMFYDLPDPVQFARDIHTILADDGIWTCEQSYLLTMLRRNSIDTICHEHLEYYSLTAVKQIADMADFKIIDIKFNECNGGSFRIYFAKKSCDSYTEASDLVSKIIEDEREYGIKNPDLYTRFMEGCDYEITKLNQFIDAVNKCGQTIQIYGASTKGNCLLQYGRIGEREIRYAVERNLSKVGKMTSTGIGIIAEETMRANPPNYLLVLPWHFREEIIQREDEFLENGGQLIFPFPHFEIYSKKPKVLITGCDGMIGRYVKEEYSDGKHSLYGFAHTICRDICGKDITKMYFDIGNKSKLEVNLDIIRPDIIIHLAGISSAVEAFNSPIKALELNGMAVANICEIIHRNGWKDVKLFNASSAEIYKGHVNYEVKENDKNMYHCHPYSIAKIMGHSIVDFYREAHGMKFSNGVLFTVESKHKTGNFLLRRVADHAKKWKKTGEPLQLGPLDSYRTLLHASDAAKAIRVIMEQFAGDDYIIAGELNSTVSGYVLHMYGLHGIDAYMMDNVIYCGGKIVAVIEKGHHGLDTQSINISGTSQKLYDLGWRQQINTMAILKEYC